MDFQAMGGDGCPECSYLVGHRGNALSGTRLGCSLRPATERDLGWNEAIEAAARSVGKAHGRDLWQPLGSQIDGMAADILKLKK